MKFFRQFVHQFIRSNILKSKFRWAFILGSLLYLVSPFDLSPDVFPIIGWLDDGVLVTLIASEVSQMLIERRQSRKAESAKSVS
ncbi:MAG: DUF1232 domain-containing protein [Elainella sp. Prado103]|jgi:uncharacterized membrane protein YkvA (DUF1232 family)|nr:DUF1232 domain-containing protein [Elainella sp. Prado103]